MWVGNGGILTAFRSWRADSCYNSPTMEVIPAVDIRNGKCVRLYQGDYARETVFADSPVDVARKWEALGAPRLHLVDLDGAAAGEPRNLPAITAVVKAVKVPVELGGGIRTRETVAKLLSLGIGRVILGTAAIEQPELVQELCARYGEAIVVGIDARGGRVATRGWLTATQTTAVELARKMADLGVQRITHTDIARDGTLTKPSFAATERLVRSVKLAVVASGGVASVAHLKRLAGLGVEGAIVGRALYTGDVDLAEALAAVSGARGAQ